MLTLRKDHMKMLLFLKILCKSKIIPKQKVIFYIKKKLMISLRVPIMST